MPVTINNYKVAISGTPVAGNVRGKIFLRTGNIKRGVARFYRTGVAIPNDQVSNNRVYMNLPESVMNSVLSMLQREAPVKLDFHNGRGILFTGTEIVED
ncbi:MAG: hypothetical protein AAF495_12680 [Pseudomonadota bacterium]